MALKPRKADWYSSWLVNLLRGQKSQCGEADDSRIRKQCEKVAWLSSCIRKRTDLGNHVRPSCCLKQIARTETRRRWRVDRGQRYSGEVRLRKRKEQEKNCGRMEVRVGLVKPKRAIRLEASKPQKTEPRRSARNGRRDRGMQRGCGDGGYGDTGKHKQAGVLNRSWIRQRRGRGGLEVRNHSRRIPTCQECVAVS